MSRRNLIWMCVILGAVGVMAYLGWSRPPAPAPAPTPLDPHAEDLAEAVRAYRIILQKSYRPPEAQAACRAAIEGMARQVDGHSWYLPPDQAERIGRRLRGRRRETGLRIDLRDDTIAVVGPLPDSPAHKAAIFAPMTIEAVNGVEAKYLPIDQVRRILRAGDADVELSLRDGSGGEVRRTLRPAEFPVETVRGIDRDGRGRWRFDLDSAAGLYYVRITEFVRRTPQDFHRAYRSLSDPRGLVLDLRRNPGGELQAAAEIVDRFLRAGTIVRTEHRQGRPYVHHAHPMGTYPPIPLVVLIDEQTASAAEIVAAALRIHRRALLVGRGTYGKWSVQTAVDLGGGLGTLHLTTGRYFLPEAPAATTGPATRAARPVAGDRDNRRVMPDVDVRLTAATARRLAALAVATAVMPAPDAHADPRIGRTILAEDEQLAAAVKLLREGLADPQRLAPPADAGEKSP